MIPILITAGEASGSRLAAALMAELKKHRPDLTFHGVGGEDMRAAGLQELFPMAELSVMGLAEVLPAIPRILGRIKQLKAWAAQNKPALVITVDAQDFSSRLAKALKTLPNPAPHVQYVAPKVWAWRQNRALKLAGLYNLLLTILPFEEPFFKQYAVNASYVGHPATTMLAPYYVSPNAGMTLALLPGSRTQEFKRHWPLMLATYRRLRAQHPQLTAVLALPDEKALQTCQSLAPWGEADALTPTYGEARFKALTQCRAALAKSGTNNLEIALLGLPAVVCYRMHWLTHAIAKRLVQIPFVSLPNIILGGPVYPEFIQSAATAENLSTALHPLFVNLSARKHQQDLLAKLAKRMKTPHPPAQMAAAAILPLLAA
ncbi:MAG: lipid-A-disaccharide synthase [Proteobacteria bacterium]|nr:lipid-A-disaccharide synthase [Pseudomonadota bacterium]